MQTSTFTVGHAQADGRRLIIERHVDATGREHVIEYGPIGQADYASIMAARAAALDDALAESEVDECIATNTVRAQYQTGAEFAGRLRERYRVATQETAARLAAWLLGRIEAGQLTDLQVRNAFGLTAPQYTAMKTRMTTLRVSWAALRAAVGE